MKTLLRIMIGAGFMTLVFGTPPAYAVLGIRAARTVIAARKAGKMASSSSADQTIPQVKRQTGQQAVQDDQG